MPLSKETKPIQYDWLVNNTNFYFTMTLVCLYGENFKTNVHMATNVVILKNESIFLSS